jgi:hypothetical protein
MSSKYAQQLALQLSDETYKQSITSINLGFTLAAALAWNESIKKIIGTHLPDKVGTKYQVLYAMIVTLLAAFVFTLTQRFLKPSIKRADLKIGAMM